MNREFLHAASNAAESWMKEIADVKFFLDRGQARVAYGLLLGLWADPIGDDYRMVLLAAREEFARVGELVRYHGLSNPQSFASAHEAVATVLPFIFLALLPPLDGITDAEEREAKIQRAFDRHADLLLIDTSDIRARLCRERARLFSEDDPAVAEVPQPRPAAAPDHDDKWILVSDALKELTFLPNLRALYRFAKEYPQQLRVRQHPKHKQRRQAYLADVYRLKSEHEEKAFESLGGPAADNLPPLAEGDLGKLVERLSRERDKKRRK